MCDDAPRYCLCVKCFKIFSENHEKEKENIYKCPSVGCGGKALFSAKWETLRKRFPDLPEEPDDNVIYDTNEH